jgi:molybdopterin synthase sulfur carrier subunit
VNQSDDLTGSATRKPRLVDGDEGRNKKQNPSLPGSPAPVGGELHYPAKSESPTEGRQDPIGRPAGERTMTITIRAYAVLREVIGARETAFSLLPGETIGGVLEKLCGTYPGLREHLFDNAGRTKPHIIILKNGRNIASLQQLDTIIDEDDVLALFPPVAGG